MMLRAVLAVVLTALLSQTLLSADPAQAGSRPLYSLDASVEFDAGVIKARESVAFTNESSDTLETLVFNVTPAYYGAFDLFAATVADEGVGAVLEGSILELPLPHPVRPGASVVASLDFAIRVPWRGGRFGRGPQVMALGNWVPLLAVYRDGRLLSEGQERGWVRGQYVEVGDAFFAQTADFLVSLKADRPLSVAHTGDPAAQGETEWKFEARGVRDFALALSPSFATISQEVEDVDVVVFYLPGHEAAASTYLKSASQMLAWMKENVIPYPYRQLHLAEINASGSSTVGQEYPNLILIADGMAPAYGGLDSAGGVLATHETAHQWYYGIVGNDQLYEPWLDEAMVTWLSYHIMRSSGLASFSWAWTNRVSSPAPPNLPVNATIYDYASDGPYFSLVYRRGALFLEEIYQTMGADAFFAALKKYSAAMSGRIATPYAFLDTMQAHTTANLSPITSRYFSYPRYRASDPLRVSARYPQQAWSNSVEIAMESDAPLQEVQVFVDDSLYSRALPGHVVVEPRQLEEGPHLLTLRASDGQREVDLVDTFTVKHPLPLAAPLPVPSPPAPLPAAAPAAPPPAAGVGTEAPEEELSEPPADGEAASEPIITGKQAAGLTLFALSVAVLALGLARGDYPDTGR